MIYDDSILRALSELQPLKPDPERSKRVRRHCQDVARRHFDAARRRATGRRALESVLVGAFSLAYVLAVIHDLLGWRRLQ